MPSKIVDIVFSLEEAGVKAKRRRKWRLIPDCIWWTIWKEKNPRCFENTRSSWTVFCYFVSGVQSYILKIQRQSWMFLIHVRIVSCSPFFFFFGYFLFCTFFCKGFSTWASQVLVYNTKLLPVSKKGATVYVAYTTYAKMMLNQCTTC